VTLSNQNWRFLKHFAGLILKLDPRLDRSGMKLCDFSYILYETEYKFIEFNQVREVWKKSVKKKLVRKVRKKSVKKDSWSGKSGKTPAKSVK